MRSKRNRFTTRVMLLLTAMFAAVVVTACATETPAPVSAADAGEPVATPPTEVADEALTDSEPTAEPTAEPVVNSIEPDQSTNSDPDTGLEDADEDDEEDSDITGEELRAILLADLASQQEPDDGGLDYALRLGVEPYDPVTAGFMRQVWQRNLDAALVPSSCDTPPVLEYPSGYYTGPLIDSHFHMPQLSDDFSYIEVLENEFMEEQAAKFGFDFDDGGPDDEDSEDSEDIEDEDSSYAGGGGVDSELYNAISESDRPVLGKTITLDEIACALQHEGSTTAYTFFSVFQGGPSAFVDLAYQATERYGDLFVPFAQSSDDTINFPTVTGDILEQMLDLRPGLFVGQGEIGDSPTEGINPPPDGPIYVSDFEVARERDLLVWFHPSIGHQENLDRALKMFPEVNFIIHGDFVYPYVADLMATNDNVYFAFNDIFGSLYEQFTFGEKEVFFDSMESNWEELIQEGLDLYEELIYTYPDRFMWGTDRAAMVWNYHADTGQLLAKLARDFIGRFDPEVQDKIAYLNAESLLQ